MDYKLIDKLTENLHFYYEKENILDAILEINNIQPEEKTNTTNKELKRLKKELTRINKKMMKNFRHPKLNDRYSLMKIIRSLHEERAETLEEALALLDKNDKL